MRMTVLAGILAGVNVRTEVAPDGLTFYICRAVVWSSANAVGAGGLLASVFQSEVSATGLAVKENGRLELDGIAVSKVLVDELVEDGLLDVTSAGFEMKPVLANIFGAACSVGVLDSSKWYEWRNVTDAVVVSDSSTIFSARTLSKLGTCANILVESIRTITMVYTSVPRLTEEWRRKFVLIVCIKWSWVATFHRVQTSESFGIVTRVPLASFWHRKHSIARLITSADLVKTRTSICRRAKWREGKFNDSLPIRLAEVISVDRHSLERILIAFHPLLRLFAFGAG
mmetsp:Transcript_28476/g.60334  ORF Transcript_28476/g.60334 Transcript_28476/m.60334 type:complete len:285 (-) Transcript_28476:248-1102(-)